MQNTPINYIEFKTHDLEQTKAFYSTLFGWNSPITAPHTQRLPKVESKEVLNFPKTQSQMEY